jgi:23S rRNA (cytidine1920-2'-O)/16S rRNA (cytidine1409-2'-O)-methyltransferase
MSPRRRADIVLVERGLFESRAKAQAAIDAGCVTADAVPVAKASDLVRADAALTAEPAHPWVSRGGVKLGAALDHFAIDAADCICLDVGASTGGFTDCLLQHGASRVIAVDTGYGQIDFRLRSNPRVRLLEKTNARYLTREMLGAAADFIAMDVSFISATLVLPAVLHVGFPVDRSGKQVVVLVKPQFEAGRDHVGKGGIVRDPEAQQAAVEKVRNSLIEIGAKRTDVIDSPILGAEGNREFLLHAVF